jgi:TolA-binding protein
VAAEARARKPRPKSKTIIVAGVSAAILVLAGGLIVWQSLSGRLVPTDPRLAAGATSTPPPATMTTAPNPSVPPASPSRSMAGRESQPSPVEADGARELSAARARIEGREFDQAITDLQRFLAQHAGSALAPEAILLKGQAQELSGQSDAAIATYGEFRTRYRATARMPDATFRLAQLTGALKGREGEAITLYTEVFSQYPNSPRAPEALFAKAGLQDKLKLVEVDPKLSTSVPASLVTYRVMTDRYPRAALTQHALLRSANMYDTLKRYDLEAQVFERLGASFPQSGYDGWFKAAELYDRRLKDKEKARAAYLQVPPTSPHYRDAQKRAGR